MSTPEIRKEIVTQVEAINSLHNRIIKACWEKCIPQPRDAELSIGEMTCIDRCVPKFLETQAFVRQELQEMRQKEPVMYP